MQTKNSLSVTTIRIASLFLVLSTSIVFAEKCYSSRFDNVIVYQYCSPPGSSCNTAKDSLVKFCQTGLAAKINETVNNYYFLKKRALSFDLVECLRATTEADCAAKSCFWFSGKDCIPKELVP